VEVYIRALQDMQVARKRIAEVFNEVDVLVTPTAPGLPEPISGAELAEAKQRRSLDPPTPRLSTFMAFRRSRCPAGSVLRVCRSACS